MPGAFFFPARLTVASVVVNSAEIAGGVDVTIGSSEEARAEVQRLMGKCVLRLQQYERLIKEIVALHEVGGPVSDGLEHIAARRESVSKFTLGSSVGELMENVFSTGELKTKDTSAEDEAHAAAGGVVMRLKFGVQMSTAEYERTKADLKELVDLRNGLIHHFLEKFDLGTANGCEAASAYLIESSTNIAEHFERLQEVARQMDETRKLAGAFMATSEFAAFLFDGVAPDGQVDFPRSGIVRELLDAAGRADATGWVQLEDAVREIAAKAPEQTPGRYRRVSWRQVVNDSGQFDLQYRVNEAGKKQAWYRVRKVSG